MNIDYEYLEEEYDDYISFEKVVTNKKFSSEPEIGEKKKKNNYNRNREMKYGDF